MKQKHKYISVLTFALLSIFQIHGLKAQDEPKKEEVVKVTDAKLQLSFDTSDGSKFIKALVTGKDASGAEVPVKGVTVKIFIKKSFGSLTVEGDNMVTDDLGTVSVEFPKQMPGDKFGNVNIVAKVEDDPKTGELETSATSKFGIPSEPENTLNKRSLWAARSNAPISLVIAVNSMVLLVWGIIFYILIKLIIINRLGKKENSIQS